MKQNLNIFQTLRVNQTLIIVFEIYRMFPFSNYTDFTQVPNINFNGSYWMVSHQPQIYFTNLNHLVPQNVSQLKSAVNEYGFIVPNLAQNPQVQPQFQPSVKYFTCNCQSTKCKKQYCVCFKNNQACGPKCKCNNCQNIQVCSQRHSTPIKKQTFCSCKKSKCEKKYCECFVKGVKCGEQCNCCDCKN